MPDHQDLIEAVSLAGHFNAILPAQGQWLLHENVLAGSQRRHRHSGMLLSRGGNSDGMQLRAGECFIQRQETLHAVLLAKNFQPGRVALAYRV